MIKKVSVISMIVLAVVLPANLYAQNFINQPEDTVQSHYFLWFHGHWDNKKKNTFDIKPAFGVGGGGKATVQSNGNVNVQAASMDDWDKFFDQGLDDIDKWEKELKSTSHDYEEWEHHLNMELLPHLELKKKEWKDYKLKPEDKKINLAEDKVDFIADAIENSCRNFKPRFDQIMSYYYAHRHEKYNDIQVPPPPEIDYSCSQCDTNIEKRNKKLVEDYKKKFEEPEAGMIRDLLPKLREMALLGVGDSYTLGDEYGHTLQAVIIKDFYNRNGVCSYLHKDEMWEVIQFLAYHVYERAQRLVDLYHKNYKTFLALEEVYLSVTRQNLLLGNNTGEGWEYWANLAEMAKESFYYYENKLIKEHDWSQLSNYNHLFGFERDYELLGGDDKSFMNELTNLIAFINNFQLSIDMTVNANGKMIMHVAGKAKVIPEFYPDSNKCYTWVVALDKTGVAGFPIKDKAGIIHCELLQNTMPAMKYIGTHKYYTELKQLKMDYCHPGKDTVMFTRFIPDPSGDGWWVDPYGHKYEMELNELDSYFQDKSKAVSEAGNIRQMAPGIKSKGLKLAAQLKAFESKMKSGGLNGLTDIHKIQELANQSNALLNNQKIGAIFFIDFPITADNFTKTLVNKTFSVAEVNPMVARVVHGTTTIKVEYTGK